MPAKRSDKEAIHLEYISTDISLRELARKHNVSLSTAHKWKQDGHWDVERKAFLAKATKQAAENLRMDKEHCMNSLTERMEKVLASADRLLFKVDQLLNLEDELAPRDLKSISSVLLDVVTVQNMEKDGEDEGKSKTVNVHFAGEFENWAG